MSPVQQTATTNAPVQSDQQGQHPDLVKVVTRHLAHSWQKPVPEHTRRAADAALDWLGSTGCSRIVLDSYCGTGLSTSTLASRSTDTAVIGVDKSRHRLERHVQSQGNYRLFRAECEPFWRCLVEANIVLDEHWILYPNPWPKSSQVKRRVHGHPAFPLLRQLGGTIELRSNWPTYVKEFATASHLIGIKGKSECFFSPNTKSRLSDPPITLFERKYADRGQQLWRFQGSVAD